MAKPFEAATKQLVEAYPDAWLTYLGLQPTGPVAIVDADLAAVTAEADKVPRVDAPVPWLVHIEFQAGADPTLGQRMRRYNVLLHSRHGLDMESSAERADQPGSASRRGRGAVDRHVTIVGQLDGASGQRLVAAVHLA